MDLKSILHSTTHINMLMRRRLDDAGYSGGFSVDPGEALCLTLK